MPLLHPSLLKTRRYRLLLPGILAVGFLLICGVQSRAGDLPEPPLEMDALKARLSFARGAGASDDSEKGWPRRITYRYRHYDPLHQTRADEERIFELEKRPQRIIPHAVGIAEILWAICPRDRLKAVTAFAADPDFSFIAEAVAERYETFTAKQTERIIGWQPDLVFTVFYSDSAFKARLASADIPFFDLGYFGTYASIREQIDLIGRIIGEPGNAKALLDEMEKIRQQLPGATAGGKPPVRVLYYAEGGYVSGKSTSFTSVCEMAGAVNAGAEQGIESLSQIDHETLLQWNPDAILVREGSRIEAQLYKSRLLSFAKAVRRRQIYAVPQVYLTAGSQYMLLTANLLAGIVREIR